MIRKTGHAVTLLTTKISTLWNRFVSLLTRTCRKVIHIFFRPSDKFYFELELWETDFEDRLETYVKVSDLHYAVELGFDLKKHVMGYIDNKTPEPGYLEPIYAAFRRYIKFLRTGVGIAESSFVYADLMTQLYIADLVDLFCKEVMVCLPIGSVPRWDYIALLTAKQNHIISGAEFYRICTSPSDYYVAAMERINTQERTTRKEKAIQIIEIDNN